MNFLKSAFHHSCEISTKCEAIPLGKTRLGLKFKHVIPNQSRLGLKFKHVIPKQSRLGLKFKHVIPNQSATPKHTSIFTLSSLKCAFL
jgi:hypothetical protein